MGGFHGTDFGVEDFRDVCCVVDIGAGVLLGYAGSAMLVNVDPLALIVNAAAATSPMLSLFAPSLNPKAMILSRGWNVGPQASAGISGSIGYLWPKAGAA